MNFKEDFRKKLKKIKAEQVISIVAVIIVLTLAVVLTITAVNNRAKKNSLPEPDFSGGEQTETKTPPKTDTPKENEEPKKTEQPDTTPTVKEETPPSLSLPVSGSLSKTHSVDVQVFSKTMNEYRTHLGVDISTTEEADVRASADGVVQKVWEDPMMGQCVALTHAGECVTVYKNLAATLAEGIEEGATVRAGQLLGKVGDSAMMEIAEEPHLHMEVTVKGLQVDPMEYFSRAALEDLTQGDNGFEDPDASATPPETTTPAAK
ncbi:MAG: peptidoglycan DD-metalloendopeptidase family protein [Clostridia bacterium]|nr:peptidoglycan DD-metalloendopeptidase family protein [Clostridia bacterium]